MVVLASLIAIVIAPQMEMAPEERLVYVHEETTD
jgi:hypothetical protein